MNYINAISNMCANGVNNVTNKIMNVGYILSYDDEIDKLEKEIKEKQKSEPLDLDRVSRITKKIWDKKVALIKYKKEKTIENLLYMLPSELVDIIIKYYHMPYDSYSDDRYTPVLRYSDLDNTCCCMSYCEYYIPGAHNGWSRIVGPDELWINPHDETDYDIRNSDGLYLSFPNEAKKVKVPYYSIKNSDYHKIKNNILYGNKECLANDHACICNDNTPTNLNTITNYTTMSGSTKKMQCRASVHGESCKVSRCSCPYIFARFRKIGILPTTCGLYFNKIPQYTCEAHPNHTWKLQKTDQNYCDEWYELV